MATISFRIDDNLKREAEHILDELGLNMSTAMTMFTKVIIREHGIPLVLTNCPFYSRPNQDRLAKSIAAYEDDHSSPIAKTMAEREAAAEDL